MDRVFYPGMGLDILHPLLCVSNLDEIHAIDAIDDRHFFNIYTPHTSKHSIHRVAFIIKNMLIHGSDEAVVNRCEECGVPNILDETNTFACLPNKATIVSEHLDTQNQLWTLEFGYQGKLRKLYYHYHRNFNCVSTLQELNIPTCNYLYITTGAIPNFLDNNVKCWYELNILHGCKHLISDEYIIFGYEKYNDISEQAYIMDNQYKGEGLYFISTDNSVIDVCKTYLSRKKRSQFIFHKD